MVVRGLFLLFLSHLAILGLPGKAAAWEKDQECLFDPQQNQFLVSSISVKKAIIGSVSKVFTSAWALAVRGPDGHFRTQAFLKQVSPDLWDVHIQGDNDPYFSTGSFQYLVARLNEKGIHHIRNLTFDGQFYFLRYQKLAFNAHQAYEGKLSSKFVIGELLNQLVTLNVGYESLKDRLLSQAGIRLPERLILDVQHISASLDSRVDERNVAPENKIVYQSESLMLYLKEMNRDSNNYMAAVFFKSMGGVKAFNKFADNELGLSEKDFIFFSGSGYPITLYKKSLYNVANCRSVIRVLVYIDKILVKDGQAGIEDILPVAGSDASPSENSTVSDFYKNDEFTRSLVAKTGTVSPAISLAGMISTQNKGNLFFSLVYRKSKKEKANPSRAQIAGDLMTWFKKYGGKKEIACSVKPFFPFDWSFLLSPNL